MDPIAAKAVFWILMVLSGGVWFVSLHAALNLGQSNRKPKELFTAFGQEQSSQRVCITGERTVLGALDFVSRAIASNLTKIGVPGMFASLFEIVNRTPKLIEVRKTGPLVCNQSTGMYFSEAEFNLQYDGENRVLVKYRIGFERLLRVLRRTSLVLILGCGLPTLFFVGCVVWFVAVQNPNPATRWQVFQLLQLTHVLWPPFLVMYVYRVGRTHARTYVSNVLATLDVTFPSIKNI